MVLGRLKVGVTRASDPAEPMPSRPSRPKLRPPERLSFMIVARNRCYLPANWPRSCNACPQAARTIVKAVA